MITRALKLGARLKGWAQAWFDPTYAGNTGAIGLPVIIPSQNYVLQPDGSYGPEVDSNGNPIYRERTSIYQVIPEVAGFLSAYSLDNALSKLGLSGTSSGWKGYIQTGDAQPTKPVGAGYAYEMSVPFSNDYGPPNLPAGVTWTAADPEWVYFTKDMVQGFSPWVKVYFYNGSVMLQDYAYLDVQGRYKQQSGEWSTWGGVGRLGANVGAVRVSASATFSDKLIRGSDSFEYRMRVRVGSVSATSAPTVGGCYLQFY